MPMQCLVFERNSFNQSIRLLQPSNMPTRAPEVVEYCKGRFIWTPDRSTRTSFFRVFRVSLTE